jgi:hypothetical protein
VREAETGWSNRVRGVVAQHWIALTLLAWAIVAGWFLLQRWPQIQWLALGDTDDNMRLMQVRAWLGGQDWYDLRQYRLNPPAGFDIHWSRVVDLPIAALILLFRLFTSPQMAEKLACGVAPLIPLGLTMLGLGATVRRLVAPVAWPLAIALLLSTSATILMFMPERIDHHGWQLAMLSLTVAGLCDPRATRGGATVGLASALSLAIGLEMLPYAAMAGAIIALRWVWDREESRRLAVYGTTLGGATAASFAAFASNANYALRCDALTPVWLSVVALTGALLLLLALISPWTRGARLALGAVAGIAIVAAYVLFFPQCLGRLEGVSPELQRTWLDNVREAKPIYKHPFRTAFPIATLPVVGLVGAGVAVWRARGDAALLRGWATVALFATFATLMLLWQARAGPAAQLLAVPSATALAWVLIPLVINHRAMPVRVFGTVGTGLIVSGLFAGLVIRWLPIDRPNAYVQRVNRANARCASIPSLSALDRYPAQTVFTFTDLGPRLITLTHHSAIAGPYHRNGAAILDVQHAFSRSPDEARRIMKRHGATLLLLCPNMAESTIYRARNPGGFYDRMAHGQVPGWLTPLPLPANSPLRLFRID